MNYLTSFLKDFDESKNLVDQVWDKLTVDFLRVDNEIPIKFMERREISFHDQIKLLGILSKSLTSKEGDIVEIGVWKGKSLALMERMSGGGCKLIGIDPCELKGQKEELNYFFSKLFGRCNLIINYSHLAMPDLLRITKKIKLLHIDGGHQAINVWLDFLLYNSFVISGGFVIFDDYNDFQHSPEVKIAVDELNYLGVFSSYEIIGATNEFPSSFILRKY
jgi:SAM-dependent methyltransferase